jgi:hypothetical protein
MFDSANGFEHSGDSLKDMLKFNISAQHYRLFFNLIQPYNLRQEKLSWDFSQEFRRWTQKSKMDSKYKNMPFLKYF